MRQLHAISSPSPGLDIDLSPGSDAGRFLRRFFRAFLIAPDRTGLPIPSYLLHRRQPILTLDWRLQLYSLFMNLLFALYSAPYPMSQAVGVAALIVGAEKSSRDEVSLPWGSS